MLLLLFRIALLGLLGIAYRFANDRPVYWWAVHSLFIAMVAHLLVTYKSWFGRVVALVLLVQFLLTVAIAAIVPLAPVMPGSVVRLLNVITTHPAFTGVLVYPGWVATPLFWWLYVVWDPLVRVQGARQHTKPCEAQHPKAHSNQASL